MSRDIIDDIAENIVEVAFMLPVLAVKGVFNFFGSREEKKRLLKIEKIEDMQKLHWREFEKFIAFALERQGFKTKIGTGVRDGGIDIEAHLNGRKYLIQCKKWNKYKVSEPNIREFLGAISDFDIDAKGIYVTTSNLTSDAKAFAERNDIEIWDKYSLEEYVSEFIEKEDGRMVQVKPDIRGEIVCDKCGGKLVKRIAKKGSNIGNEFLGCENYPKCKNIVNL